MERYLDKIEQFLENNDWIEKDAEFTALLYATVDKIKTDNIGLEAVEPILRLMERHPLVSFGAPGALVHFVEGFCESGYEPLLEQSLRRMPTVHTVWMLNRLINGADDNKADEYIQTMKQIYANTELPKEIRDTAKDFLEYHEEP